MGYSLSEKQQALSQKFKVHVMSLRLISNKLVRMAAPQEMSPKPGAQLQEWGGREFHCPPLKFWKQAFPWLLAFDLIGSCLSFFHLKCLIFTFFY